VSEINTKRCHACNQDVPLDTKGKCPLCGEQKGYQINVGFIEHVKVSDSVKRTLESITEEKIPNKKAKRISLIIWTVSVIVAILIPTIPWFYPFVILIAVFVGAIPLFYTSYDTKIKHLIDRG